MDSSCPSTWVTSGAVPAAFHGKSSRTHHAASSALHLLQNKPSSGMGTARRVPANPWLLLGCSMASPWLLLGSSLAAPSLLLGCSLAAPRLLHGWSLASPWPPFGHSMATPWLLHGSSLTAPWLLLGHSFSSPRLLLGRSWGQRCFAEIRMLQPCLGLH